MPLNALYGYYVFDHLEEVQLLCIGGFKVHSWIVAFILVRKLDNLELVRNRVE